MSDRRDVAREVNAKLKSQKVAVETSLPAIFSDAVSLTSNDYAKSRSVVGDLGAAAEFLAIKEWAQNMTTEPGDIVYDPNKKHCYVYTGSTSYQHTNPLFYPGAAGVYYWAIVPQMKDGIKVYPDVSGIIVAVKHKEVWWNVAKTHIYSWNGADNNNCVWPPTDGNEWTKVG